MLASMLVAVAMPTAASAAPSSAAVAPAFASFADRLPIAVSAAEAIAGDGPERENTAPVAGTVSFPADVDLTRGRTFVVAYAPGTDVSAPLAAAAVGADGAYAMRAPVGDVILAVVSEGRAVFDYWGELASDIGTAGITTLDPQGLTLDVSLAGSAQVDGTVAVPAGVVISGQKIAVAVYPAGGAGHAPVAANYVTDAGTFAVGGLPAGQYRVAFVSTATGAASEWWKDAPGFRTSAAVSLSATAPTALHATLDALRLLETAAPTISGTATVGQKLTAVPGAWTDGAAFAYQWYANGSAIAKATSSSLLLPATVVGKKITVRVTGTKPSHRPAAMLSAPTAAVVRPLAAPTPTISGTAAVGQTFTVRTGTWTAGTKLSYQWYVDGVAVTRATSAAFKIPATAMGKTITVVVKGTKAGYATSSKRSKASAVVKGILAAPVPRISGSAVVGSRLTAGAGTWTTGTTLRYQWYMNGRAITRATGSTLVVTAAMAKARITVSVTGTKSGYVSASRSSAKTAIVSYPSRTKPASAWNCPSWAPIKGNASSMIYHVRSGAYYAKTKPEECFSSESAATRAGYRKSKR